MSNEEARKKNVHADFVSFWILGPIPQDSICLYEIYYMKEEKKTDSQTTSVGIFIDSFKLALLTQIVGMLQNNNKKTPTNWLCVQFSVQESNLFDILSHQRSRNFIFHCVWLNLDLLKCDKNDFMEKFHRFQSWCLQASFCMSRELS